MSDGYLGVSVEERSARRLEGSPKVYETTREVLKDVLVGML